MPIVLGTFSGLRVNIVCTTKRSIVALLEIFKSLDAKNKMKASIYDLTNKTNEHKKVIFDWSVGYFKNDTGGNVVRW